MQLIHAYCSHNFRICQRRPYQFIKSSTDCINQIYILESIPWLEII